MIQWVKCFFFSVVASFVSFVILSSFSLFFSLSLFFCLFSSKETFFDRSTFFNHTLIYSSLSNYKDWSFMFTSRNNSFMEKPDSILAFPWDKVIHSFTTSSTSLVYQKKIVILNLSTLSSLVSNCSIFSMSLLLLIRFVYCTLAQSPTLANIKQWIE